MKNEWMEDGNKQPETKGNEEHSREASSACRVVLLLLDYYYYMNILFLL